MYRLAYLAVVLLTSLFAAAANSVVVRSVSVSDSNTYAIEGSGFRPKKGTEPVVTINGQAATVKSFTDSRIVCSSATPATGGYTLKITNSRGQSTTFEHVIAPREKEDSAPAKTETKPSASSDRTAKPSRAKQCQIEEVTPGVAVPPLPSYCYEQ